ncbi:MAG: guanine deaminase [Pseudomonadota bacterium]
MRVLRGRLLRWAGSPFEIGDAALAWEEDGAVAIEAGRISAAGPADAVIAAAPEAPVSRTAHIIAPGFVDCHLHYPQTGILASWGATLIDWLNRYTFPEEAGFADRSRAEATAPAFFAETLRNGTTATASFATIHAHSVDAYFEEAARRGVAAIGGRVMMDRNAPETLRDTAERAHDESAALIARWHVRGRALYAISPRFAPTSSEAQLEAAGALSAAHPGCLVQTHLSETEAEIAWVRELFPWAADYLAVYDRFGLTGPASVFGHAIHLEARERARLAEAGAAVAHCPTSNLFLGSGACDVAGLAAEGVRMGLASDIGGGPGFSMLATMRAAYEIGQLRGTALTPAALWWLATAGSAAALRLDGELGDLVPGSAADLVLLDPEATPVLAARCDRAESPSELLFALIMLGDDRAVAETWAAGRPVHRR